MQPTHMIDANLYRARVVVMLAGFASSACARGRSETVAACEEGAELLSMSFEEPDPRILLTGTARTHEASSPYDGRHTLRFTTDLGGAVQLREPVELARRRALVNGWMRGSGFDGTFAVRISTDEGATWRETASELPTVNVERTWTLFAAEFTDIDAPALFAIELTGMGCCNSAELDRVAVHDPDGCESDDATCPFPETEAYWNDLSSVNDVVVSGGWTWDAPNTSLITTTDGSARTVRWSALAGSRARVHVALEHASTPGTLAIRLLDPADGIHDANEGPLLLSQARNIPVERAFELPRPDMQVRIELLASGLVDNAAVNVRNVRLLDSAPCGVAP